MEGRPIDEYGTAWHRYGADDKMGRAPYMGYDEKLR